MEVPAGNTLRGEAKQLLGDISRFLALAGEPNGGLIVTSGARGILHRDLIIALAARHQLPTIYGYRTPSQAAA